MRLGVLSLFLPPTPISCVYCHIQFYPHLSLSLVAVTCYCLTDSTSFFVVAFVRSGGLAVDDEIIAIDDNEIQGLPLESALQLLKTNNREVHLIICPVSVLPLCNLSLLLN